jgi:hypothetical protein
MGGGWFTLCRISAFLQDAPSSREFLHWSGVVILGLVMIVTMAVRRLDKGSVALGLAFLLTCTFLPLLFMRDISIDSADFLMPSPLLVVGIITILVQVSANTPSAQDDIQIGDPLGQPSSKIGCVFTLVSLLIVALSLFAVYANGLTMEAANREIERYGLIAAASGAALAILGCLVALFRPRKKRL